MDRLTECNEMALMPRSDTADAERPPERLYGPAMTARQVYERWARRHGKRPSVWGLVRYYLPF